MPVNCDKCGRFTSADDHEDGYNFCSDCWHARLHRYGPGWWEIRREVLQRDNYTCQHCGMTNSEAKEKYGRALSVHHKQPYEDGGTHDLDNLVSLCHACHARVEGFK